MVPAPLVALYSQSSEARLTAFSRGVGDSSGFSTSKFARWFDHRWGKEVERRTYLKAHIFVGVKSNVITSIEITDHKGADSPQLIPLMNKTNIKFTIKEVSADKAYSSKANLQAIQDIGATPYISFRSNTTGAGDIGHIWNKMYWHYKQKPQEFLEHYHKRSNVETAFHMIKQKFGSNLMTKNPTANISEVLYKALCHNLCVLIQEFHENQVKIDFSTETPKMKVPLKCKG